MNILIGMESPVFTPSKTRYKFAKNVIDERIYIIYKRLSNIVAIIRNANIGNNYLS